MRSRHFVPALTVGTLLLAACGSGSNGESAPIDPPATEASAPAPDSGSAATEAGDVGETGTAAPAILQFSAPLVGGGEIDLSALAGKPTVFWFWAPT